MKVYFFQGTQPISSCMQLPPLFHWEHIDKPLEESKAGEEESIHLMIQLREQKRNLEKKYTEKKKYRQQKSSLCVL